MEIFASIVNTALKACFWVLVFTRPAHDAMLAVTVMVAIDYFVGIWAAKKRGEPILSWGLRRTVTTKILPYYVAILASHLVDQEIFAGSYMAYVQLMKATAGFVAVAEIKSIFENLGQITGLDFWTFIKEKLQPTKKDPPKEMP